MIEEFHVKVMERWWWDVAGTSLDSKVAFRLSKDNENPCTAD